jgi:hypothetical protein
MAISVDTFDLQISDPVLLLNEIAKRYESAGRIIMEYIDNALDDAEELYRANGGIYPYTVRIQIHVDSDRSIVTIKDNCRGMTRQTLRRIVQRVGESQKRGCTWVNGQFGFGVHAFRAAAKKVSFTTRNESDVSVTMQVRRNEHRNLAPPEPTGAPLDTDTGTGTIVAVGPFDSDWRSDLDLAAIKMEIELHFERLLARPNLVIEVRENDGEPIRCEPFDYDALPGKVFHLTLAVREDDEEFPIEVSLKVTDVPVPSRVPRFFRRGRRINEVKSIKSFMNKSRYRTSVWGHDHLVGYIEVGELVGPVITRDDFERCGRRTDLYDAIYGLEDELRQSLTEINQRQEDQSLGRLESVLRKVLSRIARDDALRFRSEVVGPGRDEPVADQGGAGPNGHSVSGIGQLSSESDGAGDEGKSPVTDRLAPEADCEDGSAPGVDIEDHAEVPGQDSDGRGAFVGIGEGGLPPEPATTPTNRTAATRKKSGFDIKFMDLPPDIEGRMRRSQLLDGTIVINVGHSDFQERLDRTRQGQARVTERMVGYLAGVISIHYKDQYYEKYRNQPDRRDQLFDEQVDFICRLESALKPQIGVLQAQMDQVGEGSTDGEG